MGNNCSKDTWRCAHLNLQWNKKFKNAVIDEIKTIPTFRSVTPCLMMVGPVAAGKSSLVNTFLSAGKNEEIVRKALVGTAERSYTLKYCRYGAVGELGNKYRLCDTMGILDRTTGGITLNDLLYAMRGHIAPGYEFSENKDIQTSDDRYISKPAETDISHCLVVVLSSEDLKTYQSNYKQKVKEAIRNSRKEAIPAFIILTKVDKICDTVRNDNSKIFTCKHVKDVVRDASEVFNLPEGYIFPVINYSSQVAKFHGHAIDIIALLTLRMILQSASDFLEGRECN